MGAVYQAKDLKRQGAICAIKEMSLSMVPPEEQAQAIQNFKIEAKMLWGLNHPNLPAFTGFFSENQRYFLVMEYIDGFTLEDLLERNAAPFSERRVLGWARQLCDVLEYLHSQNPPIIFRDMKPGNIMLMRNSRIKLIDFGIARFFRSTSSQDTQLLGTPGYAPPEQYGKAQTDERSDIYSLAMTLFHLLTYTLSETGFGLKDVRAINPQISAPVARALEKATALEPDERYEDVAAFRRALLGVGTFIFENGDQATTPDELADLFARYPEEASDYLAAGEVELWLHEIGEEDLSRTARRIRMLGLDQQESVEYFIRTVMAQHARARGYASNGGMPAVAATVPPAHANPGWLRKSAAPVQVSPRTLDFGSLYPGISASLVVKITGDQGLVVSGTIQPAEPWIMVDTTQFDGMITYANVRINSTRLRGNTRYTGSILITPYDEGMKEIAITVEVDVQEVAMQVNGRRGKTVGADLDDDEDDDEDDLTMGTFGSLAMAPQTVKAPTQPKIPIMAALAPSPQTQNHTQNDQEKYKYRQSGSNGTTSPGWDPWPATPGQRLWQQRGLTISAAFMLASLIYTVLSQLSPLPPSPWFVVILAGMSPLATLGALVVNWRPWEEMINRAITGMGCVFLTMGLVKVFWQLMFHAGAGPVQLLVMLLAAASSATIGIYPTISDYILFGTSWLIMHMRWLAIIASVLVGGGLGYFLTIGLAASWLTPFAVLAGIGVAGGLLWRVDYLLKHQNQNP